MLPLLFNKFFNVSYASAWDHEAFEGFNLEMIFPISRCVKELGTSSPVIFLVLRDNGTIIHHNNETSSDNLLLKANMEL